MSKFYNKIMYRNKQLYLVYLKEHHGATPPDVPIPPNINEELIYDYTTVPRVDVMYYNPKQYSNEDVIIPIYMTDWYMREYNLDDDSLDFTLNVEVDGITTTFNNMKAGEHNINLGKLSVGEHWFSLEVIDNRHNISSSIIYQEILVLDSENNGFKQEEIYTVTTSDLNAFSITTGLTAKTATEENMMNNRKGLTKLFADLQSQGYKKCILPENSVFRVNKAEREPYIYNIEEGNTPIIIPTNFTVDMNNSTFKLHPFDDREYREKGNTQNLMVCFLRCYDSHLINGTIEGDFFERRDELVWSDGTNALSGGNGEGCNCIGIYGGKYVTTENITIKQITGYNYAVTQNGGNAGKIIGNTKSWVENQNVINGELVEQQGFTTTSDFLMMDDDFIAGGFICGQVWLAFGGIQGHYWTMWFHFYDDNKNFIKSIKGTQYRRTRIPSGARYFRCTLIDVAPSNIHNYFGFTYMGSPINCGAYNCHWIDNRTCANPNQYRHFTFKDCDFTRSGQSITPCEIDLEDGWEAGMDFFLINCKILENIGTADLIQNCGHNIVMDGCENFSCAFRYRILGITVKNCTNSHVTNALGFMTKHTIRVFDSTLIGCSIGNTSADPDFYKKVKVRYKNNVIKHIESTNYLNLDGNEIHINAYYLNITINNNDVYFIDGMNNHGNTYFNNCNMYAEDCSDIKLRMNNDKYKLRVFNDCTFHDPVEVHSTAHVYLYTAIFNNCTFSENVFVNRPVSNNIGDIVFNNCTFKGDFKTDIRYDDAWVQLNNCTVDGDYVFLNKGQTNTIINEEVPNSIYAFRMQFEDDTPYHNIGSYNQAITMRKLPYISTEPYTFSISNGLSSITQDGVVSFLSEGTYEVICRSESGYEERIEGYNVNINYTQNRFDDSGNIISANGLKFYARTDFLEVSQNNCNAQIFCPTHYASVAIVQYDENYNVLNVVSGLPSVNTNDISYTSDFTIVKNTKFIRICLSTNGYTKRPILELFARTEIKYL